MPTRTANDPPAEPRPLWLRPAVLLGLAGAIGLMVSLGIVTWQRLAPAPKITPPVWTDGWDDALVDNGPVRRFYLAWSGRGILVSDFRRAAPHTSTLRWLDPETGQAIGPSLGPISPVHPDYDDGTRVYAADLHPTGSAARLHVGFLHRLADGEDIGDRYWDDEMLDGCESAFDVRSRDYGDARFVELDGWIEVTSLDALDRPSPLPAMPCDRASSEDEVAIVDGWTRVAISEVDGPQARYSVFGDDGRIRTNLGPGFADGPAPIGWDHQMEFGEVVHGGWAVFELYESQRSGEPTVRWEDHFLGVQPSTQRMNRIQLPDGAYAFMTKSPNRFVEPLGDDWLVMPLTIGDDFDGSGLYVLGLDGQPPRRLADASTEQPSPAFGGPLDPRFWSVAGLHPATRTIGGLGSGSDPGTPVIESFAYTQTLKLVRLTDGNAGTVDIADSRILTVDHHPGGPGRFRPSPIDMLPIRSPDEFVVFSPDGSRVLVGFTEQQTQRRRVSLYDVTWPSEGEPAP